MLEMMFQSRGKTPLEDRACGARHPRSDVESVAVVYKALPLSLSGIAGPAPEMHL